MVKLADFDKSVVLPAGLDIPELRRAIEYIERELVDLVEIYFEQANVFSAVVGIFGAKALDSVSAWEKNKHAYVAAQRFPDLCRRGRGAGLLKAADCLESKASKRPYQIQSHYDHAGWYIIWRYLVDPTESIEEQRPVIIWRVDVVFLSKQDWKYEHSTAGAAGGGRTHTFGVKQPARRLKGTAIYKRSDIVLRHSKPVPRNGD